ncbi:MAG: ABC transporter permease [Paludibacter sp.]|jgi:putative ABC transport system permease protein|nr:ABC transporter permease [Paludibacter sp.]
MNVLQEIFASLKHNKLRTILTGLSVSWGIFILIVLLAAGNGLQNGVTSNFSDRATNMVQMWPGRTSMPYKGLKSGRSLSFSDKQILAVKENLDGTEGESGVIDNNLIITYKDEYGNFSIKGVEPVYNDIFNLKFEAGNGRFINQLDLENKNKVIVLDKKIEETLFRKESAIGKYVQVGKIMFKVVGVNTKKERWGGGNAYIPFTTAQAIFNPDKKFYNIAMTVNGMETLAENEVFNDKLKETMSKSMYFDAKDTQALWLRNSQENYLKTMRIFGGITIFVSIIGIFTLIAGIVGVSNIMLVSVRERTREIGIRKAIGAPPASILLSIIIESILITTVFGYIGMILGVGLIEIVNIILQQSAAQSETGMSVFKDPSVQLSYVYISTAILILAGVFAGYMPARRAVRIKPIEAMRE